MKRNQWAGAGGQFGAAKRALLGSLGTSLLGGELGHVAGAEAVFMSGSVLLHPACCPSSPTCPRRSQGAKHPWG